MTGDEVVIPERYPEKAKHLRLFIWVASILLSIGLVAPIITLSKFVLIQHTFSVLSGALELAREGQVFLFFVITGFSVVLPILKLWVLYRLVSKNAVPKEKVKKHLHWMHEYGKWSMLDVFVVAVLVVAVKLGAIAVSGGPNPRINGEQGSESRGSQSRNRSQRIFQNGISSLKGKSSSCARFCCSSYSKRVRSVICSP